MKSAKLKERTPELIHQEYFQGQYITVEEYLRIVPSKTAKALYSEIEDFIKESVTDVYVVSGNKKQKEEAVRAIERELELIRDMFKKAWFKETNTYLSLIVKFMGASIGRKILVLCKRKSG